MNYEDIYKLRKRLGLNQADMGATIARALGRDKPYSARMVRTWEQGETNPPAEVEAFLGQLALEQNLGVDDGPGPIPSSPAAGPGDTEPGPGTPDPQVPLTGGGGVYAQACEQLVEIIAAGVGLIGVGIGSEGLQADGLILDDDKKALGKAWGRLAETNATFARWLVSATQGGAWVEVAIVSGTTFSKMVQAHQQIRMRNAALAEANGHFDSVSGPEEPAAAAA